MSHDEFQFQDLVDALEREKSSKTIIEVHNKFFKQMRKFISELESEVTKNSQDINTLDRIGLDQLLKAKKMAKDLINRRLKKIALAAVHQQMGVKKVDTSSMTERENELFNDIKDLLDETRGELRDGGYRITKEEEGESAGQEAHDKKEERKRHRIEEKEKIEVRRELEEKKQEEVKKVSIPKAKKGEEILVYVTDDVPTFVDMETTYTLKKEDVVTLQADTAKVLISRGLAREVVLD
ncbi:MAG: hypothetical protein R6U17_03620 [Thermoplasmata archaeon]